MKRKPPVILILAIGVLSACSGQPSNSSLNPPAANTPATVSPKATEVSASSKNGDYDGRGVVTKIDLDIGSVEMDHEDIPGLMPPMRMEFYVSDKKMLDGLKPGDTVDFVLRYRDGTETVVKIGKAK